MTFRSRVTAVFVKKFSWPIKKSSPSPLWEFRLPVTALALSARRPFGRARFVRGLDNDDGDEVMMTMMGNGKGPALEIEMNLKVKISVRESSW